MIKSIEFAIGTNIAELRDSINRHIKEGFQPRGYPFSAVDGGSDKPMLVQQMMKRKTRKVKP